MTKQEALQQGFVYEGYCGIVPVYLTEVDAFGHKHPGLVAKYWWLDGVLTLQEAVNAGLCRLINLFKPGMAEGITIMFGERLDGKVRTEKELD